MRQTLFLSSGSTLAMKRHVVRLDRSPCSASDLHRRTPARVRLRIPRKNDGLLSCRQGCFAVSPFELEVRPGRPRDVAACAATTAALRPGLRAPMRHCDCAIAFSWSLLVTFSVRRLFDCGGVGAGQRTITPMCFDWPPAMRSRSADERQSQCVRSRWSAILGASTNEAVNPGVSMRTCSIVLQRLSGLGRRPVVMHGAAGRAVFAE
jgi:hypothetical protein